MMKRATTAKAAVRTGARLRRRIAVTVTGALIAALLQGAVLPAAQADDMPGIPASEKALSGHDVTMAPRQTKGAPGMPAQTPKQGWPKAATAQVTLPAAGKAAAVRAGSTAVALTTTATITSRAARAKSAGTALEGAATVRVLDHQAAQRAGVDGMLFSVARQGTARGNTVGLSVDYSAFAQAYGGSYAARARLVQLPACAATTPGAPACTARTSVAARNDPAARTLTASSVSVPAAGQSVLFGVESGTSSDHGDYKATSLSPSAAWDTNLNTGDFSWSYAMPAPAVPGKFAPSVGLSYSSGAVDGRTSNANNQSSWAGDGFSLWPGSIERSYKPCADDGVTNADGNKPGDLCWAYDNATMSFNGHSGELIATGTNTFRLKDDDGTKIDRIYGASNNVRANGARNDEYWKITTTDGTRYYFGYNRLPGWSTGKPVTNSTWTVPVYGNDSDEFCHAATFADSWCQQAWRWNLDYAVDVHGNAIAYFYDKETNTYARNLKPADETSYDRGGSLNHIEYGLRDSTAYTAKALARVDFASAERCLPETGVTCDPATIDTKSSYWYDTPWDLNCKAGADCTKSASPTFWTRKRLTDVTTQVLKPDSSGYSPIDTWHLDYGWGTSDIDYQLLLKSIKHTGKSATPEVPLPPVTFGYDQRTNRLDIPGDDTAPFIKERLATVVDESGGQLDVTYSTATCDAAHLPAPATNTTRCFPVYFLKEGASDPTLQWFNKYVVDAVVRTDRTLSSPDQVTRYSYLDGAAWHYDDDDGLTKQKYKTWSTWRGYGHVRVQTGGQDPVGMKSQTDHYFLRGMDGNKGSTGAVTVSDDHGGTITDADQLAGFAYKTEQYSAPGGKILSKTVSTPWSHQTASRVRDWGTTTANLTGTANTRTWTSLDNGAGNTWRQTDTANTFENTAGRITRTDDFGDESTSADDQCTRITYADNTALWLLTAVARSETVAVNCSATPDRSKDVLSDVRTAYDGLDYGAAPTKGDATRVASLKSHNGTTGTYLESGATYDTTYGRQLTATDITGTVTATETAAPVRTSRTDGQTMTTGYSPATGFPTTVTVTSPPVVPGTSSTSQSTKTTYDTLRGLPITVSDPNTKRTDMTYDALGRNLKVWLPDRSKANNDIPNYQFVYTITDTTPLSVATKTLKSDAGQQTSYTLYDGFLQPRQTQSPGPNGGRLVTDTFYDERGQAVLAFAPYYNTSAPSGDLLKLDDALGVETQTRTTYDGLGRVTRTQQVSGNSDGGTVLATTTTAYGGDRTSVTPPAGGTSTTTVTDARGRTTELLQYHAATPNGTADTTRYSYTPAGKLAKLTDPSGTVWSYVYDQRGNQTTAHDPDKGDTTSVYDDRNQLVSTTDAKHQTITHLYDGLGRETETHDGTATGTLLTRHVWDPSGYKGQLASATRYVGGATGTAYTTTYNIYDNLYRPNRITTTIPSVTSEEALAGSYQTNIKYNANGTVQSTGYPAAGSLAADVLVPTYDDVLRPVKLTGTGGTTYLTDATYSFTGKPLQYTYQSGGKKTQVTNTYQWGTQRLSNSRVDREDVPGTDKSSTYGYDEAGNVTSINDVSRDGTDNQCFTYDYLGRLTEAWAQTATTCTTPSAALLGGPAPYWQSYTYDLSGSRATETLHDVHGVTANDTHRAYTTPAPTAARPHTLSEVDTTGPTGTSADYYTYDATGNTATRTVGGTQQNLTWDSEGHLTKVTQDDGNGGTTTAASYVYDADGNRLLTRTPAGTTLYLGSTEITLAKNATTPKATRYYDLGGGTQAVRTDDNKLSFLISDHLGTSQLAIAATDLAMQQRRSTPFGGARGTTPSAWPGSKGFVGGTNDPGTGLTHLGARDYDPTTGRFLSADPVLDPADPQQINGYAYSNNSPVTYSDPTGLRTACGGNSNDGVACPKSDKNGDGWPDDGSKTGQNTVHTAQPTDTPTISIDDNCDKKCEQARDLYKCGILGCGPTQNFGEWCQHNEAMCWALSKADGFNRTMKKIWETEKDILGISGVEACKNGDAAACLELQASAIFTSKMKSLSLLMHEGNKLTNGTLGCITFNSFSPMTLVLMKDGKLKPIKDVKPGDEVEAADPNTGKHVGPRRVTARLVHHDDDLIDITVQTATGEATTVHTTSHHPFWDDTSHTWVEAGQLTLGHTLKTAANGHIRVVAIASRPGAASMYNLTIEQLHTYYVLTGDTPVLVHNTGGAGSPAKGSAGTERLIEELEANGYIIRGTEISARAANGVNVRFDVIAEKGGILHFFDAKNGPRAMFTKPQGRKGGYASIESNGGTWYGENAEAAGLSGSFGPHDVKIAGYGGYKYSGLCR
ncbi:polymorphic toxin-type HINT domain-containing protein [Actinacidiphila alni]|uniref:polymorphic toxin-type HINT domain-containing protein n=1 Tax=Actinacidiphila alni TaxID=380248 RepID=UPI0033E45D57